MKKLFKVAAIILGIFVLLLVVATVAVKIFFPAEKIKSILLKELTAKLHREVSMDDVSLGLIKGLEIGNLRISESKTFAQGTFVSVEKLGVRVLLLPLISKRVEVDTLVLTGPKVSVVRGANGKTFNFSDLLALSGPENTQVVQANCQGLVPCAYAAPMEPATAAAPPVNLQISKLEIQNGQVHFSDHSPAHQNAEIGELNLKVNGFSLTDFFSATVHAKITTMGVTLLTQAAAKINMKTSVVQLSNAALTVGESKISASGQVSDYASPSPKITLTVVISALNPSSFGSLAALPPALSWTGVATGNLDLEGDLARLNMGGNLHLDNVQLRYGKQFSKPAKVPFSFSFNGTVLKQSSADIREFGLKLGTLNASGNARVEGLAQKLPSLSLHVVTNDFSTTDVLALLPGSLPPGTKIQGPAKLSADVSGTPASFKAAAKFSGQDLVITSSDTFKKPAGMPFEATFKGESVGNGERLNIESLLLVFGHIQTTVAGQYITQGQDARLALTVRTNDFQLDDLPKLLPAAAGYQFSGPGHLDMKITNLMSAPAVDGVFTLHDLNVKSPQEQLQQAEARIHFATPNALASTAHLSLKTEGQLTAQHVHNDFYDGNTLKLVWGLTDVNPALDKISGTVQFNQGNGAMHNLDKLAGESAVAKVILMPIQTMQKIQGQGLFKSIGLPALDNLIFSSIRGDYAFHAGVMDIRAFELLGRDLSMNTTGSISHLMGDRLLNLRNQVVLAKGSIGGGLGQALQDDQGRPTLKFTITGPADHAQVVPDLKEAGQKVIQQLFKNVDTSDPNKALNDIGNNLKNLFK